MYNDYFVIIFFVVFFVKNIREKWKRVMNTIKIREIIVLILVWNDYINFIFRHEYSNVETFWPKTKFVEISNRGILPITIFLSF